ncbi:MAG: hypothetical protein KIH10_18200, partial [Candidatus Freyarchaeota archaeon]|nr:hypothetical protein [Candidatus Jordarchaeia archaeon]
KLALLAIFLIGAVLVGAVLTMAYTRNRNNGSAPRLYDVWADKYNGVPTKWYTIEELIQKYHIRAVSWLIAFFSPQYYNKSLVKLIDLPLEFRDKIYQDQPVFQYNGEFYQVTFDITKLLPADACLMFASPRPEWRLKLRGQYSFEDFIEEFQLLTIAPYDNTTFELTFPSNQWNRLVSETPIFQYQGKFYQVQEALPKLR